MPKTGQGAKLARTIKSEMDRISFREEQGLLNPFSIMVEKLCQVNLHKVESPNHPPGGTVRIALVSMPDLTFERKFFSALRGKKKPPGVDPKAYSRCLAGSGREASKKMMVAYSEALEVAADWHANIVCFSELGLPGRNLIPVAAARRIACEVSRRHNLLVIAGSSHDSRTLCNTGYVFHPGGPSHGRAFHKAVSAISMGEYISTPSSKSVLAVEIFGLRVAILVCLDIADYASLASVVRVGDRIDMILVPCYTKKFEKMVEIAKVASKALPGLVAMVNAKLERSIAGTAQIARFGELEKPTRELALDSGATVSMVEFSFDRFQEQRTRLKTSPDNQMEWLFGRRDRPIVFG